MHVSGYRTFVDPCSSASMQAKSALDEAEIAYEEIDLGQYPKLLAEVKQATGRVTVPQVSLQCNSCNATQVLS